MTRRGASVSGVAESSARCRLHVTPGATGTSSAPYLCRRLFLAQALFPVIHLSIAPLHSQCCSGQPSGFLSVCFCALVCIVLPHWAGHPTGIRNQLGRLLSRGERGPLPASSSRTQAVEPQRQVKSERQKERRARPQLPKQRSTRAGAGWLRIIQLGSE